VRVAQVTSKCLTSVTDRNNFVLAFKLVLLRRFLLIFTECVLLLLDQVQGSPLNNNLWAWISSHDNFMETKTYFMLMEGLGRYFLGEKKTILEGSQSKFINTLMHR